MKLRLLSFFLFGLGSFSTLLNAQDSTKTKTTKKRMVVNNYPAEYTYIYHNDPYVTGFALGIDYQQDQFSKKLDWDSKNHYNRSGGFNIYFMSGNQFKQNNALGSVNWGAGFAMTFQGDGDPTNVQINTTNKDSAKTHLSVISPQIYAFARYEYKVGPFYPFIGVQTGVKWYSTSQNTETMVPLSDYENQSSNNIDVTGSLYVAPEVGVRVRLGNVASLVASYTIVSGGNLNLVDLGSSKMNSWQYVLDRKKENMNVDQFKVGFLFNLSERSHTKKIIKEAHSDTTFVDEDEINKNTYPCPCCPKTSTTISPKSPQKQSEMDAEPFNPDYKKNSTIEIYPSNSRYPNPSQPSINIPKKPLPGINPAPVSKPKS
jgi:hypothetical protein